MPHLPQQLKGIAIATVFFVGLLYVQAWTGAPAGIPPANNVDAPVNVGVGTQYKSGSLGIGGLLKVYGTFNVESGAGLGKVLTSDATGNASWQAESDPTVPAYIKDGTDWSEVTNKPTQTSGNVVAGCSSGPPSPAACFGGAGGSQGSCSMEYEGEPNYFCPGGSSLYVMTPAGSCASFICVKN